MSASVVERRRHRRVELPVQVALRPAGTEPSSTPPIVGESKDIGLAGAYIKVKAPFQLPVGAPVSYSVDIPASEQRKFPFTRLLGTGWIVRVTPEPDGPDVGVAIAFPSNATVLSAVQP